MKSYARSSQMIDNCEKWRSITYLFHFLQDEFKAWIHFFSPPVVGRAAWNSEQEMP